MFLRKFSVSIIIAMVWIAAAWSSESSDDLQLGSDSPAKNLGLKTTLVGMGSFEAGEFTKCEVNEIPDDHLWFQKAFMQMGFITDVNERTKLSFVGEVMMRFPYGPVKDQPDETHVSYYFYPHNVSITYAIGDVNKPLLKLSAGVMPFKYNPDVRNLGEYIFRTNTYPATMRNRFDFPMARVTGFQLSSTPIDSLNFHLILATESEVVPLRDFGPAFFTDYTFLKNIVSVGAGAYFHHLWSVAERYTTPKVNNNIYMTPEGDTAYYTFRGSKVMGRLSLDFKPLLPFANMLGSNDLRLYSEIAFIGLKNQGVYYDEQWRRRPIMVGFNFPTFKVFDVVSAELEWYNWDYRNSYTLALFEGTILPKPDDANNDGIMPVSDWQQNALKWSVYAKRTFGSHFSVIGQVGFDHMQIERNSVPQKKVAYFGDAMHKHGDWAWVLKTQWVY